MLVADTAASLVTISRISASRTKIVGVALPLVPLLEAGTGTSSADLVEFKKSHFQQFHDLQSPQTDSREDTAD